MSSAPQTPLISVVVACFKQADPLDLVLESFLRQDFPHEDYEIIVVDDHSPDHLARHTVAQSRRRYPQAAIHYLRQYRCDGGHYRASAEVKNVGLRLASGEYVFFNNAEICQAGQSLAYIARKLTASPVSLCLRGRVIDAPRSVLEGKSQVELDALHDGTERCFERVASADHAGLAAVPRRLLLQVGGNDERFDHWGKEDLDLARRLKAAGAVYVYDEKLKSFHVSHPPNFQRHGDYRRMASLLEESAKSGLVEANVGRLWGQLEPTPAAELQATVLVEAGNDTGRLHARLEALYYGEGAENIEIVVAAREPLRPRVEALLARYFKGIKLLVLPEAPEACSLGRLLPRLRSKTIVFCGAECAPWSWEYGLERFTGAMSLVAKGDAANYTARQGQRRQVPWAVDHETARGALSELVGFEDLPAALMNSPGLGRWAGNWAPPTRKPTLPHVKDGDRVLALVPYYQCAPWVERSLASLASQTRGLDAIVLLLDGGDAPPDGLLQRFPKLSVFASDELVGPYALIQAAIEATNYDWYLFQDADDWSAVDRVETLLDTAARHNAELVGSQEIRVFEDGSVMPVSYPLDVNAALAHAPGHALLHPSSLVRRGLVMRLGGFATGLRFGGDTEFVLRAAHEARIVNTSKALYFRRLRAGSLTTAPETGLDSPVRKALLIEVKERARANATRVARAIAPELGPCRVRPRIPLRHVSGPALGI